MMHLQDQDAEFDHWRALLPDEVKTNKLVVKELHAVPYFIHSGVQSTLDKVPEYFCSKGMIGNIQEYVESCPVCQVEKADHTLSRGEIKTTHIPEEEVVRSMLRFYYRSASNKEQKGLHTYCNGHGYSYGAFTTM